MRDQNEFLFQAGYNSPGEILDVVGLDEYDLAVLFHGASPENLESLNQSARVMPRCDKTDLFNRDENPSGEASLAVLITISANAFRVSPLKKG